MCLKTKRILILNEHCKKMSVLGRIQKSVFESFTLITYSKPTYIQKHQCMFFLSGHRFFVSFQLKKNLENKYECCGPCKT
jgi:hypothetical protein